MPTRVGKTRTPFTLRRIGASLGEMKQRLWPNPLYLAAGAAEPRSGGLEIGDARAIPLRAVLREQRAEGLDYREAVRLLLRRYGAGVLGSPDVLDWVPAECSIDMRQFASFAELRAFLKAITPEQERRYRDAARAPRVGALRCV